MHVSVYCVHLFCSLWETNVLGPVLLRTMCPYFMATITAHELAVYMCMQCTFRLDRTCQLNSRTCVWLSHWCSFTCFSRLAGHITVRVHTSIIVDYGSGGRI